MVTPAELPESLLRYVIRTRQRVILDDASAQHQFSGDEYLRQRRSKSVLCLPLVEQANLVGILYLENNSAPRVFTPNRVAMLELLASQAAMSLGHAQLYADLARLNAKALKRAEEMQAARQTAVLEEQNRLADEIHEALAQSFTGISMQLEVAQEEMAAREGDPLGYIQRAKSHQQRRSPRRTDRRYCDSLLGSTQPCRDQPCRDRSPKIREAVRRVAQGETFLSETIAATLVRRLSVPGEAQ